MDITNDDFIAMAIQEGVVLGAQLYTEALEADLETTVFMEQYGCDGNDVLQAMIDNRVDGVVQQQINENSELINAKRNILFS